VIEQYGSPDTGLDMADAAPWHFRREGTWLQGWRGEQG